MLARTSQRVGLGLVAAGLLVVVAAQLLASMTPYSAGSSKTGAMLGNAGFVYLTGLRTTLAGLLWKHADDLNDAYFANAGLDKETYMLPMVQIVTALDPKFTEPYYVAQWVIARTGDPKTALTMTREGIKANPDSGLLRSSYAQLLQVFFHDDAQAYEWALRTVQPDSKWRDTQEKFQGWAIARDIFKISGDTKHYDEAVRELQYLSRKDAVLAPSERVVSGR